MLGRKFSDAGIVALGFTVGSAVCAATLFAGTAASKLHQQKLANTNTDSTKINEDQPTEHRSNHSI